MAHTPQPEVRKSLRWKLGKNLLTTQERALLRAQIRALEAATNAGTNEIGDNLTNIQLTDLSVVQIFYTYALSLGSSHADKLRAVKAIEKLPTFVQKKDKKLSNMDNNKDIADSAF